MTTTKPRVIALMASTLDGRIDIDRWSTAKGIEGDDFADLFEEVHGQLGGDAWIVGRTTMEEFSDGDDGELPQATAKIDRQTFKAKTSAERYGVAIDAKGKLRWKGNTANGDHVIEVLTEGVSDAFLAHLQKDGVSYIFAGTDEIDLPVALGKLSDEFGIATLLLEGGGRINGSFVAAGLVDEYNLLLAPIIDGFADSRSSFAHDEEDKPVLPMRLVSTSEQKHGVLLMKYETVR